MPKAKNPFQYNLKEHFDVGDNRRLTNEILKASLSQYGDPFGFAAAASKTQADPLELLQNAPNLGSLFLVAGLVKKGTISSRYAGVLGEMISDLVPTLVRASKDEDFAEDQIKVIHKILNPEVYELPSTVVSDIASRYITSPPLARGWELRGIMQSLGYLVVATRPSAKNVLDGPVKITERPGAKDNYLYPLAVKHWKPGTTLQSLAIRIYLEQLREEGVDAGIDEISLKRDLRKVQEWDKAHLGDWWAKPRPDEYDAPMWRLLPTQEYSAEWKSRKRNRRKLKRRKP